MIGAGSGARVAVLPAERLLVWFRRLVAAGCLAAGVVYWVRLVGLFPGPLWRFDLMPVHWQVVSVTLAVLLPFAAIGLWMLASWGPVIFFACALIELSMHLGFPELFGREPFTIAGYGLVVILYLALVVTHSRQRRQRDVSRH